MKTVFSLIGQLIDQLIDLISMSWDFSPVGFVLFVVCVPIVLVFSYAVIRDTFDPYYGYPKGYREFQKRCKNSK